MIKDLSFSSSVGKYWIYSRWENKNTSSYSVPVVQQYSCHMYGVAKVSFNLLIIINRWIKDAVVPVHAMGAYGGVAI